MLHDVRTRRSRYQLFKSINAQVVLLLTDCGLQVIRANASPQKRSNIIETFNKREEGIEIDKTVRKGT